MGVGAEAAGRRVPALRDTCPERVYLIDRHGDLGAVGLPVHRLARGSPGCCLRIRLTRGIRDLVEQGGDLVGVEIALGRSSATVGFGLSGFASAFRRGSFFGSGAFGLFARLHRRRLPSASASWSLPEARAAGASAAAVAAGWGAETAFGFGSVLLRREWRARPSPHRLPALSLVSSVGGDHDRPESPAAPAGSIFGAGQDATAHSRIATCNAAEMKALRRMIEALARSLRLLPRPDRSAG